MVEFLREEYGHEQRHNFHPLAVFRNAAAIVAPPTNNIALPLPSLTAFKQEYARLARNADPQRGQREGYFRFNVVNAAMRQLATCARNNAALNLPRALEQYARRIVDDATRDVQHLQEHVLARERKRLCSAIIWRLAAPRFANAPPPPPGRHHNVHVGIAAPLPLAGQRGHYGLILNVASRAQLYRNIDKMRNTALHYIWCHWQGYLMHLEADDLTAGNDASGKFSNSQLFPLIISSFTIIIIFHAKSIQLNFFFFIKKK